MEANPKTSLPGPIPQLLNKLLHRPPLSFLSYGIFWSFFLIVLSPLAGAVLTLITAYKTVRYIILLPFGLEDGEKIKAVASSEGDAIELAVLITGCDSGFGYDLALGLASKGFVVFAGCLRKESWEQFAGINKIKPLQMDITDDTEVADAEAQVRKWFENDKGRRFFHALVNNAGIGSSGRIDWIKLEAYRSIMEVNYFSMIRVTQTFLPIMKSQRISRSYNDARIINITSAAGLIAMDGGSLYAGSKFAAEAFSTCLRHECEAFGVHVATVNPSFHTSNLTGQMGPHIIRLLDTLRPEVKEEYGEEYFQQYYNNQVEMPQKVMWDGSNVRDEIIRCIELKVPPPQVVIGLDARFMILAIRHLPVWLQDIFLFNTGGPSRKVKPSCMIG